ncbi:MAG: 50S ribosomal protein L29 [Candidatus Bathyarchaeia archaeon]
MPVIRLDEIRDMTPEQRKQKLEELKTELSKLRTLINAGGSVENPSRIKALKKAVAKIETIIHEEANKQ